MLGSWTTHLSARLSPRPFKRKGFDYQGSITAMPEDPPQLGLSKEKVAILKKTLFYSARQYTEVREHYIFAMSWDLKAVEAVSNNLSSLFPIDTWEEPDIIVISLSSVRRYTKLAWASSIDSAVNTLALDFQPLHSRSWFDQSTTQMLFVYVKKNVINTIHNLTYTCLSVGGVGQAVACRFCIQQAPVCVVGIELFPTDHQSQPPLLFNPKSISTITTNESITTSSSINNASCAQALRNQKYQYLIEAISFSVKSDDTGNARLYRVEDHPVIFLLGCKDLAGMGSKARKIRPRKTRDFLSPNKETTTELPQNIMGDSISGYAKLKHLSSIDIILQNDVPGQPGVRRYKGFIDVFRAGLMRLTPPQKQHHENIGQHADSPSTGAIEVAVFKAGVPCVDQRRLRQLYRAVWKTLQTEREDSTRPALTVDPQIIEVPYIHPFTPTTVKVTIQNTSTLPAAYSVLCLSESGRVLVPLARRSFLHKNRIQKGNTLASPTATLPLTLTIPTAYYNQSSMLGETTKRKGNGVRGLTNFSIDTHRRLLDIFRTNHTKNSNQETTNQISSRIHKEPSYDPTMDASVRALQSMVTARGPSAHHWWNKFGFHGGNNIIDDCNVPDTDNKATTTSLPSLSYATHRPTLKNNNEKFNNVMKNGSERLVIPELAKSSSLEVIVEDNTGFQAAGWMTHRARVLNTPRVESTQGSYTSRTPTVITENEKYALTLREAFKPPTLSQNSTSRLAVPSAPCTPEALSPVAPSHHMSLSLSQTLTPLKNKMNQNNQQFDLVRWVHIDNPEGVVLASNQIEVAITINVQESVVYEKNVSCVLALHLDQAQFDVFISLSGVLKPSIRGLSFSQLQGLSDDPPTTPPPTSHSNSQNATNETLTFNNISPTNTESFLPYSPQEKLPLPKEVWWIVAYIYCSVEETSEFKLSEFLANATFRSKRITLRSQNSQADQVLATVHAGASLTGLSITAALEGLELLLLELPTPLLPYECITILEDDPMHLLCRAVLLNLPTGTRNFFIAFLSMLRWLVDQEFHEVSPTEVVDAKQCLSKAVSIWLARLLTRNTKHDLAVPFMTHFFNASF